MYVAKTTNIFNILDRSYSVFSRSLNDNIFNVSASDRVDCEEILGNRDNRYLQINTVKSLNNQNKLGKLMI